MSETYYKQCELRECNAAQPRQTFGWVPDRGAKDGALVQLPEYDGVVFEVVKVYHTTLSEAELKEKQKLDRGSLPSIR